MSNSVDILIKADDQATAKLQKVDNALDSSVGRWQAFGKKSKAATEAVGALANISGASQLAGFAGQLAGITEKASQFAEAAKEGGASSLAFKAGIAGLVGTIAFGLGKALADVIWKTAEFEKQMEITAKQAAFLDRSVGDLQSRLMSQAREDIELIQDPEAKQAAYKALIDDLNKNIEGVSGNVAHSRKEVLKWANAWQITGDRKQYAKDAEEQLQKDMERLDALKRERDEIVRNTSERAKNIEAIKAENAAKDRSRAYVEDLKREVQYLKASVDERRQLDAMRNAVGQDQGEAYRLLAERDAILAKQAAEKEFADQQKKDQAEHQRSMEQAQQREQSEREKNGKEMLAAAEKIKQKAIEEKQRVEDLKQSERERLELIQIELEQGKEAAKVKEMMNRGIDEKTAKEFVAEEKRLEMIKEAQEAKKQLETRKAPSPVTLTATETRLLTRGASEDQSMVLQRQMVLHLAQVSKSADKTAIEAAKQTTELSKIKENTKGNVEVKMVK